MGADVLKPPTSSARRYEAVLRLSEALSMSREPEELTKTLSEQLREFLEFFQFYIIVYKENSTEIEWAVLGSEKSLISAYSDVSVEQRPSWRAYITQEPFHISDWDKDIREIMHGDAVHISLPDAESGKFRVYALDFPRKQGFVKQEMLITPVGGVKRALD